MGEPAANASRQNRKTVVRRTSKATLIEWLDQARRLWIAAETHGLVGKRFTVFAEQIGIDRTRAYELMKRYLYRDPVLTRCEKRGSLARLGTMPQLVQRAIAVNSIWC